jgi:hypothetical protein
LSLPFSSSGSPKQRTLPVYFLGKKHSASRGEKSVLPPPTYPRPRDSDGPEQIGPSSISLSTFPVLALRATSLPTLSGLSVFSAALWRQPETSWLYIGQSPAVSAFFAFGASATLTGGTGANPRRTAAAKTPWYGRGQQQTARFC